MTDVSRSDIHRLMKREEIKVCETVKVRSGAFGDWVVWVIRNDRPEQYGVYESKEFALEVATTATQRF